MWGQAVDFGVAYDAATNSVHISPSNPYVEETKAVTGDGYLTNGKPVTEENVLEILRQIHMEWPEGTTWGTDRTPGTFKNEVPSTAAKRVMDTYRLDAIYACGGYAAMVSSLIFGDAANPARRQEDLSQIRPGDIVIRVKTSTVYTDMFRFAQFMTPSGVDMFGEESTCLNLNVWTDSLSATAKKPVLVFMHGGTSEDAATGLEVYDGHGLADHTDLVFVTVNARLGNLGYVDMTELGGGNNLAIRDMLLSLVWVKRNIAQFGGDPNNITIMGQSGGGSKVGALAASPYSAKNDLFQKVVLTSASANNAGSDVPQATRNEAARTLADRMKNGGTITSTNRNGETVTCTVEPVAGMSASTTDAEILAYLQNLRTDEIDSFFSNYGFSSGLTADGEILDGRWNNGTDGLSENAARYTYLIGSAWAEMKGGNSVEAIQNRMVDRAKSNLTTAQREALLKEIYGDDLEKARELFTAAYPGVDFYNLHSLVPARNGNFYNASAIADKSTTVYEYLMAYEMPYFGGTTMLHTADLAFWFYSLGNVPYQIAGDEVNAYKVADTMSSALAAFCRTGNPSTPGLQWKAHDEESDWIMVLNTNSQLREGSYDDDLLALMAEHDG